MERLNSKNLQQLPREVARPEYVRDDVKPGIVHLGIGAFHRAHQAYYTEAVLNRYGGDWAIVGCSLRSASVREQLAPQDGLYTLVERSGEGEKLQVIGAVTSVVVGPDNPAGLVQIMADPQIRIVSMTVTEKGYCHDPATGNLNRNHPDIQKDLKNLSSPVTAIGYLVASLQARHRAGAPGVTLLSCDNLPDNGRVLQKVVRQFAEQVSPELLAWIDEQVTFPCTMIDRIVPATTDEDREDVARHLGVRDEGVVVAEPFTQWVIEDRFANGRPAWEKVGAQLVDDVRVYEKIKLRLLNGAHSTLAYTGYLSGFDTISEVMAEPAFVNMIALFMDREAGETIAAPDGFDLNHYREQLRQRFRNSALKHRTWQIAMDGSQKLPQRLLETLREQLAGQGHIDIICLAVAAWIRYVSGVDEQGGAIDVSDPLAAQLRELCDAKAGDPEAMVRAVVGVEAVFGSDLSGEDVFVANTVRWLRRFYESGVRQSIRDEFSAP